MKITLNVILTYDYLFQELYFGPRYKFNVCVNFHVSLYRNKNQEELWAGKGQHTYPKGNKEMIRNIFIYLFGVHLN